MGINQFDFILPNFILFFIKYNIDVSYYYYLTKLKLATKIIFLWLIQILFNDNKIHQYLTFKLYLIEISFKENGDINKERVRT